MSSQYLQCDADGKRCGANSILARFLQPKSGVKRIGVAVGS